MHNFSLCVPTLILRQLLIRADATHSQRSEEIQIEISIRSLQTAFLTIEHISIPTLSWLTQHYLGAHNFSKGATFDMVEALIQSTSQSPSTTRLTLLRRYVDLCITLPISIPRTCTLAPVVNVLNCYATAAAGSADVVACNIEVSNLFDGNARPGVHTKSC